MLVYQVRVARSAEMNLSNHFPQKRQIGFGRYHAYDTLSRTPKGNRNRDVWLSLVRSVDSAYIILPLHSFVKLRRFALVGKVRGKINSSVGYFHHLHTPSIDNRSVSEAVIVFYEQSCEQVLFFAPQLVKTCGVSCIRKPLDLTLNK